MLSAVYVTLFLDMQLCTVELVLCCRNSPCWGG